MLIGTFSTDSSRRVAVTTTSSRVGSLAAVVSACATVTDEIPMIKASAQGGPADRTQWNIDPPPFLPLKALEETAPSTRRPPLIIPSNHPVDFVSSGAH